MYTTAPDCYLFICIDNSSMYISTIDCDNHCVKKKDCKKVSGGNAEQMTKYHVASWSADSRLMLKYYHL